MSGVTADDTGRTRKVQPMKTQFNFDEDDGSQTVIEIEADSFEGRVNVRLYFGPSNVSQEHRKPAARMCLTKSQARAVASSMMGCAAEV